MKFQYKKILLIILCLLILLPICIKAAEVKEAEEESLIVNRLNRFAQGMGFVTIDAADLSIEERIAVMIGLILKFLLSFLGVIFIVLLIYAGFMWMTAKGDEQQISKAKETIKSALIGLMVVAMAYAIVKAVETILIQMGFFK